MENSLVTVELIKILTLVICITYAIKTIPSHINSLLTQSYIFLIINIEIINYIFRDLQTRCRFHNLTLYTTQNQHDSSSSPFLISLIAYYVNISKTYNLKIITNISLTPINPISIYPSPLLRLSKTISIN